MGMIYVWNILCKVKSFGAQVGWRPSFSPLIKMYVFFLFPFKRINNCFRKITLWMQRRYGRVKTHAKNVIGKIMMLRLASTIPLDSLHRDRHSGILKIEIWWIHWEFYILPVGRLQPSPQIRTIYFLRFQMKWMTLRVGNLFANGVDTLGKKIAVIKST